jgi:hypothetical protein
MIKTWEDAGKFIEKHNIRLSRNTVTSKWSAGRVTTTKKGTAFTVLPKNRSSAKDFPLEALQDLEKKLIRLAKEEELESEMAKCPFPLCKGKGKLIEKNEEFYVECSHNSPKHNVSIGPFKTRAKAIRTWNSIKEEEENKNG